jgi:hypothetical protein
MYDYKLMPQHGYETPPDLITPVIALGKRVMNSSLYDRTSHHEFVNYFVYRLLRSEHCKLTQDPQQADLFFIPAFSGRHDSPDWRKVCSKASSRITTKSASQYLPHLNNHTASRHFVLISNGVNWIAQGAACAWLRGEEPLFAPVQRFAYTGTLVGQEYRSHVWESAGPLKLSGEVISVPVLSSVHWSQGGDMPWSDKRERQLLMYFVGGFHGLQADVRRKIFKDCNKLPDCRAHTRFSLDALHHKRNAVFCLEPDGDAPWRKSYFDAISNGCIPVFFTPTTVEATSPWHWSPSNFRDNSRVSLPAEDFLAGRVSLESLRDIPKERVAEMQAAIRQYARRLQYAAEDMPSGDDAFELLLKKARLRAQGIPWDDPTLMEL